MKKYIVTISKLESLDFPADGTLYGVAERVRYYISDVHELHLPALMSSIIDKGYNIEEVRNHDYS